MKEEIVNEIQSLLQLQHHDTDSLAKKVLLVCGYFSDNIPQEINEELVKIHLHIQLLAYQSTMNQKLDKLISKDVDIRVRTETIDLGHPREMDNSTLQNHPNINLNLGNLEFKFDINPLVLELSSINNQMLELKINYSKIIGWAMTKARELNYIE